MWHVILCILQAATARDCHHGCTATSPEVIRSSRCLSQKAERNRPTGKNYSFMPKNRKIYSLVSTSLTQSISKLVNMCFLSPDHKLSPDYLHVLWNLCVLVLVVGCSAAREPSCPCLRRLQGVLLLKQQNPHPRIILSSRGGGRPALPLLPPCPAVGTGKTSLPGVECPPHR